MPVRAIGDGMEWGVTDRAHIPFSLQQRQCRRLVDLLAYLCPPIVFAHLMVDSENKFQPSRASPPLSHLHQYRPVKQCACRDWINIFVRSRQVGVYIGRAIEWMRSAWEDPPDIVFSSSPNKYVDTCIIYSNILRPDFHFLNDIPRRIPLRSL